MWLKDEPSNHRERTMKHTAAQIDAYVRGKLSPAEESALELEILDNPDMLMEFELAVALRKGLQQSELLLVKEVKTSRWWQPWIGRPMVTGVTMAVAAVALVQLSSLSSRGDLGRDDQMPSALSANVPILTFSRIRSARENTDYSLVVDDDTLQSGLAVLELEIDWPPQPEYEVTIAAQTPSVAGPAQTRRSPSNQRQTDAKAAYGADEPLASTTKFKPQTVHLKPDARGYLVMAMPTSKLSAGDYLITIAPLATAGTAANNNAASESSQPSVAVTNNNRDVAARQVYSLRVKSAN